MPNNTVETILFPKPPSQTAVGNMEELNSVLEDHTRWFREVGRFNDELYQILHSGYLIREWQIESLTAGTITAGVISTDGIYLYDENFELNGALQQIIVKDDQASPVTRVEIGKFGSGSDFGIKIRNASGTVVFQATSTTFIDGAVINNATLNGAALVDATLNGTKLINSTVTNDKVASLSASKITLSGTLTCTSATTAINVTSSGVINFSGGGDIIFKATASDSNFISFRNSANSERGSILYSPTSNIFFINNANGSDLYIDATYGSGSPALVARAEGDATLRSTGASVFLDKVGGASIQVGTNITLAPSTVVQVNGNMRGDTNNTRDLGTASIKYANMWTVVDHVGDIEFDNGWRITEPDKVYAGADPKSGLLIMNDKWQVVGGFDPVGNLWVRGFVKPLHDFLPPDIPRRESKEEEVDHARRETGTLN